MKKEKNIKEKICSSCKNKLDISNFRKSGKYFASVCNKCTVENYRERHLMTKYGITLDYYDKLLEVQNYCCDICKNVNKSERRLCVDHNHTTGKVRGLLCDTCNTALGKFRDNVDLLNEAIKYLKKHEK